MKFCKHVYEMLRLNVEVNGELTTHWSVNSTKICQLDVTYLLLHFKKMTTITRLKASKNYRRGWCDNVFLVIVITQQLPFSLPKLLIKICNFHSVIETCMYVFICLFIWCKIKISNTLFVKPCTICKLVLFRFPDIVKK